MVGRIFISYRRDDTAADARSVYQRMQRTFGSRQLFMDVDSIQRGRDFHKVLDDHLRKSAVMLAVIGPRWVDVRDADGNRRLDDPDDGEQRGAFNHGGGDDHRAQPFPHSRRLDGDAPRLVADHRA